MTVTAAPQGPGVSASATARPPDPDAAVSRSALSGSDRLLKWFLFGALASLLPIAFSLMFHLFDEVLLNAERSSQSLVAVIFGDAGLAIVAAVLAAGGLGEVLMANDKRKLKGVTGLGAALVLVGSSLWFAVVARETDPNLDPGDVANLSIGLYLIAVATTAACVGVAD